jgi:shikimate kinase
MKSPIIIGPRCCGKTERNKALAKRLDIPFVDADKEFEERHGEITPFVKNHGWEEFRRYEAEIIHGICTDYQDRIISLAPGGGAVAHNQGDKYRDSNVTLLRDFGTIFYVLPTPNLEESASILSRRLEADKVSAGQRPPLTTEDSAYKEMLTVMTQRHELYKAAAHHTLYTGIGGLPKEQEIAQSVDEMVSLL